MPDPGEEVTVPINDFWMKEIRILTSYYCGPPDLAEALKLLERDVITVDDMITQRLPLHEIQKGFKLAIEATDSIKVILEANAG